MPPTKPVAVRPTGASPADATAAPYVTLGALAQRWGVRPQQIHKHIETGALRAIRLGPRLIRIRSTDAAQFESTDEWAAMRRPAKPNNGALPEVPATDAIAKIAAEPTT